ncbi:MAG TPA: glycosyltransferase 87 family protein [Natrialbaceae archaeon]|nr:glycosyltransferase 87 family protein [Natrialbaceae archaeon]
MSLLGRFWRHREDHPWFVAGAIVVGAFFLAYPFVDYYLRSTGVAPTFWFWDFGAYTHAIDRWQAGGSLYVKENGSYHGSYLYPPIFLLFVWPFTVLFESFKHSAMAWEAAAIAVLWFGAQAAVSAWGVDLQPWERGLLLWLLLGFQPLLLATKMGQLAPFFAGLLSFALAGVLAADAATDGGAAGAAEDPGTTTDSFAAGAFTAIPAAIKIPYAPAGAHLLQDRDRFTGALAGGLALGGFSLLVFGIDPHLKFVEVLLWGAEGGSSSRHPSLWLPPYYRPFYVVADVSLWLRLGTAALISILALLTVHGDAEPETFALGVAAIPLLAPRTYAYYLVALLPAAGILIARELHRDGYPLLPVVGLFLASVHSYGLKLLVDHVPTWSSSLVFVREWSPWLQPGMWGNVLIVGLAMVRVTQVASLPSWPRRDDASEE